MKTSVVIAAGGRGKRMRAKENKIFIPIKGIPIIARAVSVFENCKQIDEIVLVVPKEELNRMKTLINKYGFEKIKNIVKGGKTRQESVCNGLNAISKNSDFVAIHDAARPFFSADILLKVLKKAKKIGAAIVAVKAKDTIKEVDSNLFVNKTLDRKFLWHAQTPQVFKTSLIKSVHEWARENNIKSTDDSSLVEKYGKKVAIVEGNYNNIKITTQEDILLGEIILSSKKFL